MSHRSFHYFTVPLHAKKLFKPPLENWTKNLNFHSPLFKKFLDPPLLVNHRSMSGWHLGHLRRSEVKLLGTAWFLHDPLPYFWLVEFLLPRRLMPVSAPQTSGPLTTRKTPPACTVVMTTTPSPVDPLVMACIPFVSSCPCVSVCVSFCLSVCLFVCLCVYMSFFVSVCWCVCKYVKGSVFAC